MIARGGAFRRGKAIAAWLGLLWLVAPLPRPGWPTVWACSAQDQVLAQATAFFAQRQEMERAERAADLFRQALERDPGCRDAALGLARTAVYIGVLSSDDKEQRAYQQAAEAARVLVQHAPQRPEGHYWLGVATALQANAGGFLHATRKVRQAKESLARALEIDPSYDHGGPHRVLGRLHFKLPAILGGDNRVAERHLRRALELGPRYWLTHIYLAVVLREQGRLEEARELLSKVIAGPASADLQAEHQHWRGQARQMLHELGSR